MLIDDAGILLAFVVALAALSVAALLLRRAVLFRRGALVACAVRASSDAAWSGGVARFDPDALRAYRVVGFRLRPWTTLGRSGLALGERRTPSHTERARLMGDPVVVHVSSDGRWVELALGNDALPGFLAWVEGRPVAG